MPSGEPEPEPFAPRDRSPTVPAPPGHRKALPSEETPRKPPAPSVGRTLSEWEEELRRLLGEPSAPPTEAPRPVATPVPPPLRPQPMPSQSSRPVAPPTPASPSPKPTPTPRPHVPVFAEAEAEVKEITTGRLTESAAVYAQASSLHERVTQRMNAVKASTERRGQPAVVSWRAVGDVRRATELAKLLRQPETARQALVASAILSPPKALE